VAVLRRIGCATGLQAILQDLPDRASSHHSRRSRPTTYYVCTSQVGNAKCQAGFFSASLVNGLEVVPASPGTHNIPSKTSRWHLTLVIIHSLCHTHPVQFHDQEILLGTISPSKTRAAALLTGHLVPFQVWTPTSSLPLVLPLPPPPRTSRDRPLRHHSGS